MHSRAAVLQLHAHSSSAAAMFYCSPLIKKGCWLQGLSNGHARLSGHDDHNMDEALLGSDAGTPEVDSSPTQMAPPRHVRFHSRGGSVSAALPRTDCAAAQATSASCKLQVWIPHLLQAWTLHDTG